MRDNYLGWNTPAANWRQYKDEICNTDMQIRRYTAITHTVNKHTLVTLYHTRLDVMQYWTIAEHCFLPRGSLLTCNKQLGRSNQSRLTQTSAPTFLIITNTKSNYSIRLCSNMVFPPFEWQRQKQTATNIKQQHKDFRCRVVGEKKVISVRVQSVGLSPAQHMIGRFGDKSFDIMNWNCAGNDSQSQTARENTQKANDQTNKLALGKKNHSIFTKKNKIKSKSSHNFNNWVSVSVVHVHTVKPLIMAALNFDRAMKSFWRP